VNCGCGFLNASPACLRLGLGVQVLGRVYPKTALKGTKVAGQFKEAAAQRPQNADLWELLGDVLSSLEPAGAWPWDHSRQCGVVC
jgi:hypothetical protein